MIEGRFDYNNAIEQLRALARGLGDTRPLMRVVSGTLLRAVEDNFAHEGRPRWPDLARGTIEGRAKQGKWPGKMLQVSGRLVSSLNTAHGAGFARVQTNVAYAAIQNFGGRTRAHTIVPRTKRALAFGGIVVRRVHHPGSTIPARPFMQLADGDWAAILEDAGDFIDRRTQPLRG